MNARTLPVSEIFGSWQGEGPSTGQTAAFVRLGRCNLTCRWCDTAYTWDRNRYDLDAELHPMAPEEIIQGALAHPGPLVVITGGEPLLHSAALARVAAGCRAAGRRVEIETNGTVRPTAELAAQIALFVVSPKLQNSGVPDHRRVCPEILREFQQSGKAAFKFVVDTAADLDEVATLETGLDLHPIWIMPLGESSAELLDRMRQLADPVLAHGWHLTGRLQVLLWEASRGR